MIDVEKLRSDITSTPRRTDWKWLPVGSSGSEALYADGQGLRVLIAQGYVRRDGVPDIDILPETKRRIARLPQLEQAYLDFPGKLADASAKGFDRGTHEAEPTLNELRAKHLALLEKAEALAEALKMVSAQLHSGDDRPDDTWADFDGEQTEQIFTALINFTAYREGRDNG